MDSVEPKFSDQNRCAIRWMGNIEEEHPPHKKNLNRGIARSPANLAFRSPASARRTLHANSMHKVTKSARENAWKVNPEMSTSTPCFLALLVLAEAVRAPPTACTQRERISQVTNTIVYVRGRNREKCSP
jgi:hypothetical protein